LRIQNACHEFDLTKSIKFKLLNSKKRTAEKRSQKIIKGLREDFHTYMKNFVQTTVFKKECAFGIFVA